MTPRCAAPQQPRWSQEELRAIRRASLSQVAVHRAGARAGEGGGSRLGVGREVGTGRGWGRCSSRGSRSSRDSEFECAPDHMRRATRLFSHTDCVLAAVGPGARQLEGGPISLSQSPSPDQMNAKSVSSPVFLASLLSFLLSSLSVRILLSPFSLLADLSPSPICAQARRLPCIHVSISNPSIPILRTQAPVRLLATPQRSRGRLWATI